MPIGSAPDKREWEELINKIKALPEGDKVGEYQDSLVKREAVLKLLEEVNK